MKSIHKSHAAATSFAALLIVTFLLFSLFRPQPPAGNPTSKISRVVAESDLVKDSFHGAATPGIGSKRDYNVVASDGIQQGINPRHNLRLEVGKDGTVGVGSPGGRWHVAIRMTAAEPGRIKTAGSEVLIGRGDMTERLRNGPDGIEHSVVVESPPSQRDGFALDLLVETDLRAIPDDDGRGVRFIDGESLEVLRYDKLLVVDAAGKTLPSRMRVSRGSDLRPSRIAFEVDDREATYPVLVDPTFSTTELADLSFVSGGSFTSEAPAELNGTVFFSADDGIHGFELWKSDGTAAGTSLVMDINAGKANSYPHDFVVSGNYVFFAADNGQSGRELWRTDGTGAGTILLKDILEGAAGSNPSSLAALGGACLFAAYELDAGTELWKSDGTPGGTVRVKDIFPGSNSSNPDELTAIGSKVFFGAEGDSATGHELWSTDGTSGGTALVKDIYVGSDSSNPTDLFDFNGTAYFAAETGDEGIELHKSNGTESGTVLVKDINPTDFDSSPKGFVVAGGILFFSAYDDINDRRLWKTDGTALGTVPVKNVEPALPMMEFGGLLYFFGDDGGTSASELWRSNGTSGGTMLFKETYPEAGTSGAGFLLGKLGGKLLFAARDPIFGEELWGTNGTPAGTALIRDIRVGYNGSSLRAFVPLGSSAFFVADDGVAGLEPWITDGTAGGTQLVFDVNSAPGSVIPVVLDGVAYFAAGSTATGVELWKTDGTPGGTGLVTDILPGPGSSNPLGLTVSGGEIYFAARDGMTGVELWRHVPGTGATERLGDIHPGGGSSLSDGLSFLVKAGNYRFFPADDGTSGMELCRTDGTQGGTFRLQDTWLGSRSSNPSYPLAVGNILYFVARNATEGGELRRSDGTIAGTYIVKDLFPGASGNAYFPTELNGTVFFSSEGSGIGQELWKTDGTAGGTVLVKDIRPGSGSSFPLSLTPLNGVLYFRADDGSSGLELWRSDGTALGTTMVKNLNPSGSAAIQSLVRSGNHLLFFATEGSTGREPYGSDGTSANTVRLADIKPSGDSVSSVATFSLSPTKAFFMADDGGGSQVWVTDGTPGGTSPAFPGKITNLVAGFLLPTASTVYAIRNTSGALELVGGTYDPPGDIEIITGLGLRGGAYTALGSSVVYYTVTEGPDGKARTTLRITSPGGTPPAGSFAPALAIALNAAGDRVELRFGVDIDVPYVLEKSSGLAMGGWSVVTTYAGAKLGVAQVVTEPLQPNPPRRMFYRLRRTDG